MKNVVYIENIDREVIRNIFDNDKVGILINGLRTNFKLSLQGFININDNILVMVCKTNMKQTTIDLFEEEIKNFINSLYSNTSLILV